MLLSRVLFAILLLASAAVARADGGAQIRLLPRADVAKPFFALGDIADIDTANRQVQERLAALRIGRSPRTGYRLSLTRPAVEEAVARHLPALRGALHWSGAERVEIHAGGQRVSGKRIVDAAQSAAAEALRPAYQDLSLKPVTQLDEVSVPEGRVALAARVEPSKGVAKRLCVPVDVTVDGQVYRTVYVWFSVRAMQKVWVAERSHAAGQPLHEAGFRSELRDVTSLSSAPVSMQDQPLRTLRVRRPIEAGGPLLTTQVETRPAVVRNGPVAVKVLSGAIAIETTGVALEDARVGQFVRVRNSVSGEMFSAQVVAEHSVVVEGR